MDKYKKLLLNTLIEIDEIDKETPWQENKPQWWIDMIEFRKNASRFFLRSKLL